MGSSGLDREPDRLPVVPGGRSTSGRHGATGTAPSRVRRMRSRELVRRTLEFDSPHVIPRQIWILQWAEEHYPETVAKLRAEYPDDVVSAPAVYRSPLPSFGDRYRKGVYVDEWGCRF